MNRPSFVWIASAIGAAGVLLICASVAAVFAAGNEREDEDTDERGEKKVSLDSLSEVVQEAIRREAGNGKIEDIAELSKNGKTFYEIDVIGDGRETEIHIGTDGALIAKKVEGPEEEDDRRSEALEKAIAKKRNGEAFTDAFGLEACSFSTTGKNAFFVLEPGYQLTLEHKDGNEREQLVITVLNETEKVGEVETRVVEERETENGELKEVSRNYCAFCEETGSVYYFGEQTTKYKNGAASVATDSWRADAPGAKPGLLMPGLVLLGARYYQEYSPKAAMDRAEIVGLDDKLQTPAGAFESCLKIEESNPLEPGEKEYKIYAPGIGLIRDEDLLLTKYGSAGNP